MQPIADCNVMQVAAIDRIWWIARRWLPQDAIYCSGKQSVDGIARYCLWLISHTIDCRESSSLKMQLTANCTILIECSFSSIDYKLNSSLKIQCIYGSKCIFKLQCCARHATLSPSSIFINLFIWCAATSPNPRPLLSFVPQSPPLTWYFDPDWILLLSPREVGSVFEMEGPVGVQLEMLHKGPTGGE